MAWSEHFYFPADHEFEDNSFSRTVLERAVPTSMNGRAQFAINDDSIGYRLTIPETEYEILEAPLTIPNKNHKRKQPVRGRRTGCFSLIGRGP